jgi:hypothetical protein
MQPNKINETMNYLIIKLRKEVETGEANYNV